MSVRVRIRSRITGLDRPQDLAGDRDVVMSSLVSLSPLSFPS
jgi:hypothetical protein